MADQSRRRASNRSARPENEADTAYWMGKVDAQLANLVELVESFMLRNQAAWDSFAAWRENVNRRLDAGSRNFDEIFSRLKAHEDLHDLTSKRIQDIESRICPLGDTCPAIELAEGASEMNEDPDDDKVITWKFVREKLAVPILVAIATYLITQLLLN